MSGAPPPPVSLGKPSLRHRLESYYSLVSPDAIADQDKWRQNFETIYTKYGGTVEGETKLAAKLAKKYGVRVRLLVAPPHRSVQRQLQRSRSSNASAPADGSKRDESYYAIDENRKDSKVLDFTSASFDAMYALNAPEGIVAEANPTIFSGPIAKLDNISKFRAFLPECDPQRLEPPSKRAAPAPTQRKPAAGTSDRTADAPQKKAPFLLAMASRYESKTSGPLSLLYSIVANRQRARVMVRYVDCVRGTLTGYLIGFDKHFNLIMKDVDEVYSGRVTRHSDAVDVARGSERDSISTGAGDTTNREGDATQSPWKAKLEAQRRRCYPLDGSGGPGPAVKQRYFHQLLVRGDNVVMVWRAEAEQSTHPQTNKSPTSMYQSSDSVGGDQSVGTPGSLWYALQRWEGKSRPKDTYRQR
ncbi:hypothetical protein ACHAXT_012368 [Thalassiosira profunda]